ncbi:MAG TPA: hypothetical protein VGZ49_05955 [Xanthobacteraceae bacterium]|jgi:hypothetical protein|nr:hypothetical protein [Xanthobacteraceae bacterium]
MADLYPQGALKRDGFSANRHPALGYSWSMIFSENRYPSRITCGTGFFGIMLYRPMAATRQKRS